MQEPKINPYLIMAIGVISVSTSAIFVKLSSAPSGVIAFYRILFSALLTMPVFLIKYRHELRNITKKDWLYTVLSGSFLAFHFILWFESLNYTSVASSTVLVTLQPLFAFAGTFIFFKERYSKTAVFSGVIAIAGSVLISWGDFRVSGEALWGDVLALIACLLVTIYMLFGQTVRKRMNLITYTFLVYTISAFVLLGYVLAVGEPLGPYPVSDWVYFSLLAVIPTLLGHTLFNWSIKWLSASTISMGILFEPVGASILAYYLLKEQVVWTQVSGAAIVIGGIILFIMDERKTRMRIKLKNQQTVQSM
ncbi:drug/metabolite transporter (DMT)-like permease [Peribacillus deserti]|uniref:Drug/metabolite transporter (DMT)-like permease n=1 Tax=Peribacillus deserti TaxID=673318 RepID=A0ABS2QNX4_9BACI|nr:DMT family transporter [Peribacillus deserti]MBM7694630.1 drug/metabolite transporter (DMT)-like permease [Peribacillus deserti]